MNADRPAAAAFPTSQAALPSPSGRGSRPQAPPRPLCQITSKPIDVSARFLKSSSFPSPSCRFQSGRHDARHPDRHRDRAGHRRGHRALRDPDDPAVRRFLGQVRREASHQRTPDGGGAGGAQAAGAGRRRCPARPESDRPAPSRARPRGPPPMERRDIPTVTANAPQETVAGAGPAGRRRRRRRSPPAAPRRSRIRRRSVPPPRPFRRRQRSGGGAGAGPAGGGRGERQGRDLPACRRAHSAARKMPMR